MFRVLPIILTLLIAAPLGAAEPDVLVGAYYFSGWWEEQPNKYTTSHIDWRDHYPGRIATLGEYNDQPTMNREIRAAADHSVHFFQFLWYFQGRKTVEEHQDKLNAGINLFISSPDNDRLHFTVEFVNQPPFGIYEDKDWEASCREWVKLMNHPRYLRLGGKPVFKIHSLDAFRQQNASDNAKVASRLKKLRDIAKSQNAGDLIISAGVMTAAVPKPDDCEMYDFLTTYMDVPNLRPSVHPYPYKDLIAQAQNAWKLYGEKSSKPYVPCVPVGWDPRPWKDTRPSFSEPTDDEWFAALASVKHAMDKSPNLAIPISPGRSQKMILIYAWNEFGEGGILAPTQGNRSMPLHILKRAFPPEE